MLFLQKRLISTEDSSILGLPTRALSVFGVLTGLLLLQGMECWRGVSAQPSGSVERRFQDQQLRDQLQDLDRQQQRDGQERLIPQRGQPSVVVPMEQSPASNLQILRRLELQGGASLLEADLRILQQRFLGQPISAALFEELRQAVVIAYDRRRILVVVASPQANANGEVVVPVLEARLGQVVVDTNQAPVRSNWARETVLASLRPGSVIRLDKLESALIKLNDFAGVRASGTLKPGARTGSSDVVLTLEAAKRYTTTLNLNNELSQYTGAAQIEGLGTAASWLGLGDLWSINGALGGMKPDMASGG